MLSCPSCCREIAEDVISCPSCGTVIDDLSEPTRMLSESQRPASTKTSNHHTAQKSIRSPSSFDSIDNARFVPGTMFAERYRIVGLLGRGGMGEVYRADDLKLGQSVV